MLDMKQSILHTQRGFRGSSYPGARARKNLQTPKSAGRIPRSDWAIMSRGAGPGDVSDAAWEAIQGAYDLQVHVAPDVIERRTDDLDLARDFLSLGLRGFVLKSHYVPTAERAKVV